MIRKLVTGWMVLAGLMLVLTAPALAQDKVDITGKYTCEGKNPAGGVYTGKVEITKKGDVYHLSWAIGAGDNYQGIGILEGDVLAVSYYGGITGIVVYKVEKGGKLTGKWAIADGKGQVFTETLSK